MGSKFRQRVQGYTWGVYPISQSTTWAVLTSVDFKDTEKDNTVLAASLYFDQVTIMNTHASQDLFLKYGAVSMTAGVTTGAIPMPSGGSTPSTWGPENLNGKQVQTIQVAGSGAATTGYIIARFFSRP